MKAPLSDQRRHQYLQAIELYKQGQGIMQIVKLSGLSYPTVRSTIQRYETQGIDAIYPTSPGRQKGQGRSLTAKQEQTVQHLLQENKPQDLNLNFKTWTRSAVAALIEQKFSIQLTPRAVGNYLNRWEINTKPQKEKKVNKTLVFPSFLPQFSWGPQLNRLGEESQTLAGQTAQRLRRDIITHQFQPGERLTFEKLSKLYKVGSSPLREALFQVMGEGLVRGEEHKGFIVAPINIEEMFDISSLRAQLEALALRLSIERGDDAWEAAVLAANHRLKKATEAIYSNPHHSKTASEEWEKRHRALHSTLCSACGSPWLLHFIEILYEHLERYRRYFWDYSVRVTGADQEHEQIVHAALERDTQYGIELLHKHFRTQAELSLMTKKLAEQA